jgi:hypothetical protein
LRDPNDSTGLPAGIVVLLVLIGTCASCILCFACVSAGRQPKQSRVVPITAPQAKQRAYNEMPPVRVAPSLLQDKRSLTPPPSSNASTATPRSSGVSIASTHTSVRASSAGANNSLAPGKARYPTQQGSNSSTQGSVTPRSNVGSIASQISQQTSKSEAKKSSGRPGHVRKPAQQGNFLMTENLRTAARSRSLSPRANSANLKAFPTRPRSLSPRPTLT